MASSFKFYRLTDALISHAFPPTRFDWAMPMGDVCSCKQCKTGEVQKRAVELFFKHYRRRHVN